MFSLKEAVSNIMHRLKNAHINSSAVVIFGGPSILDNNYDLSLLRKTNSVTFLESKALTHEFLQFGIEPDYYLMPYPEKTRTNTLQHQFIQSISCGFDLGTCLKEEYASEWYDFRDKFGEYARINRIEYPHKRYRVKNSVVLENSPLSLLHNISNSKLITYEQAYDLDGFENLKFKNPVYKYTINPKPASSLSKYLDPEVLNNCLTISDMGYVNSSAISLYPLLSYMGFKKVFFIGMDMSLLGAFEYSAINTFKSMRAYGSFFNAARGTFSYDFPCGFKKGILKLGGAICQDILKLNFSQATSFDKFRSFYHDAYGLSGQFMREKHQMKDCESIFRASNIEYINIYEKHEYALPIPGIDNISYAEFLSEQIIS